ncbi:hypothetical protein ACFQJ5_02820 [Halomicroarcula sp. GCM10025324]|uniref:hypothetical protein n=1 Tax=Haloarcula TaxID=2237 RepID=UPI0023E8D603|nr:hypothetical protein [Halomicroarcula sp. ZS-22-S1]
MDPRGIAETVGAGLVSSALAAVGLWLFAGRISWALVVGIGVVVAVASAVSYRTRPTHADLVDEPSAEHAGERATGTDAEARTAVRGRPRDEGAHTSGRAPAGDDTPASPSDSDR